MTHGVPEEPASGGPVTRPLRMVGWGLVLAFFDLRLGSFDVLPDAIGWLLVAVGAGRLPVAAAGERTARLAGVARAAALVAAVVSLPDAVGFGVRVGAGQSPPAVAVLLAAAVAVLFTAAGTSFARAVEGLAAASGDEASARTWQSLGTWYLVTTAVAGVLGLVAVAGALVVPAIVAFVAGAVVTLWLTVRCFVDAGHPWAVVR